MAMQPAICANCGGRIKVDDVDLNGFGECEYCKTPYKVIDVITIDGLPTVKSLLTTASFCVNDGNFEKAVTHYKEIITIKPNCHEAWWGLYVCNSYFDAYYQYKDKYGNSGPMTKAYIMQETLSKYALRAIEYAPKDVAEIYQRQIADEVAFIESVRNGKHDRTTSSGQSGCYIATAVYGSYTCDEVFALRRFRDERLYKSALGRLFIKVYYKLSPALAKHLPYESKVSNFIRKILNYFVKKI